MMGMPYQMPQFGMMMQPQMGNMPGMPNPMQPQQRPSDSSGKDEEPKDPM